MTGVRGLNYTTIPTEPREIITEKLGPMVPLLSNSPNQWIASSGMMLRVLVGSTVHGTAVEGQDDIDEMGICVEPPMTVIGRNREFKHYEFRSAELRTPKKNGEAPRSEPGDLDLMVYGLRRYTVLTAAGNPSMLLPLFVPDDAVRYINTFGEEMRAQREMMLSRLCAIKFLGYLNRQRDGLLGKRNVPNRAELTRKVGYDPKYAMHALRLGMQGCELLETGAISVPLRGQQLRLLREVRGGQREDGQIWPLEYILDQIGHYERRIQALTTTSRLPAEPDWGGINTWLIDVHLRHWGCV